MEDHMDGLTVNNPSTEQISSGVDTPAAAGQENQIVQPGTGVNTSPAAGDSSNQGDPVEKAFAARLSAATEKVRQESRDAYIAEQGYVWNGKKITTEAEYKNALREKELYDR
jgi:hypothetical protein